MTLDPARLIVLMTVFLLAAAGLGAAAGTLATRRPLRAALFELGAAQVRLGDARTQLTALTCQIQETQDAMMTCRRTMEASTKALATGIAALEETRAQLSATCASGETLSQVARVALERATGQRFDPGLPDLADLEAMTSGEAVEPPPREPRPAE